MFENIVNNNHQKSSQMTQLFFHNYTMSVVEETQSLADFVRKSMEQLRLTAREVERKSGGGITHSYVNKIKNGDAKNPSTPLLQALAKGLSVPEQEIFDIVRGKSFDEEAALEEGLARGLSKLSPGIKKLALKQMSGILESLADSEDNFDYGNFEDTKKK